MISIVVVSWNSGDDLAACLGSLSAARARIAAGGPDIELIVVDNHSAGFSEDDVRRAWPGARIAVLSENVGFGPAVNHAAAHARGEILLLVNPDARAVDDPLSAISRAFEAHPEWVAVAPRLVDPLGLLSGRRGGKETSSGRGGDESQETFQLRRLPTLGQAARELLLVDRVFPRNRRRLRDRYLDCDRERSFEVEQPAAAVLAIRAAAFEEIGGFDPRFAPAWWEDVDLCFRLRRLGKIAYLPGAVFEHRGGAAMRTLGYDRFLPMYYRNAIGYWRKNHGRWAALAFRALVAAGMVLRSALLPWRRGDPRPKRESWRAYRRALAVAVTVR